MTSNIFSTFVMSETTINQIKVLPPEIQLKFFWAVTNYGIDGIEPEFSGMELAIWIPMRDLIKNSKQKDDQWHEKQRENGKKGGNPNFKKGAANPYYPKSDITQDNPDITQDNPEQPKISHNGNGNGKEKEISFSSPPDDPSIAHTEKGDGPSQAGHGPSPPDNKPIESREDAITLWNRAREFWNERKLKPECRDLMMRGSDQSEVLRTFQFYSWKEIRNAIGNYAWHKFKAGPEFRPPPPYGSLAGFLKTGVEKYHDDNSLDQQFKEERD